MMKQLDEFSLGMNLLYESIVLEYFDNCNYAMNRKFITYMNLIYLNCLNLYQTPHFYSLKFQSKQ